MLLLNEVIKLSKFSLFFSKESIRSRLLIVSILCIRKKSSDNISTLFVLFYDLKDCFEIKIYKYTKSITKYFISFLFFSLLQFNKYELKNKASSSSKSESNDMSSSSSNGPSNQQQQQSKGVNNNNNTTTNTSNYLLMPAPPQQQQQPQPLSNTTNSTNPGANNSMMTRSQSYHGVLSNPAASNQYDISASLSYMGENNIYMPAPPPPQSTNNFFNLYTSTSIDSATSSKTFFSLSSVIQNIFELYFEYY